MTQKRIIALIDGRPVLGDSPITWTLREGTQPVTESFGMMPEDAKALAATSNKRKKVTLKLLLDDGTTKTVSHLSVLRVTPGDNFNLPQVELADRRWFWAYKHIRREFNKRRRIGFRRLKTINPPELQTTADRVLYAPFSLQNPGLGLQGRWTAESALKNVFQEIGESEGTTLVPFFRDRFPRDIPFEDLTLDDPGDAAIARVLSYLPEAGIFIDYNGRVVVYNKASGAERSIVVSVAPEMVGKGHIELVKNSIVRPREIHVLFTREVEVRHDFDEPTSKSDTVPVEQLEDQRALDNVLPAPDFLATKSDGTQIPQGTWITFLEAFNLKEWNSIRGLPAGSLNYDLLQKALVPYMDLWAPLLLAGYVLTEYNWPARVAAMEENYRRTFRIRPGWLDRTLDMRAYRVATVDPTSASRAPSNAYSDYAILPSQRNYFVATFQGFDDAYAINVNGYPVNGRITDKTIPAPALVEVLDPDQGIIHINYRLDWNRFYEMILPSKIDEASLPTGDLTNAKFVQNGTARSFRPIAWNQVNKEGAPLPKMTANHKIATILTMIPGAPNSNKQLHRIVVKPEDVRSLVSGAARDGLSEANGPIWEVRVGAGLETARVMWSDDRVADIEACFGVGKKEEPELKGLVVNEGDNKTDTKGAASLNAIAKAVAARIYASLADHLEGSITGRMTKDVSLGGWVQELATTITPDGVAMDQLTLPEKLERFDLLSYLPDSDRKILLRMARG